MKILVVRFKQIGDAILSSVICKSLKESYPDAEVDFVLYEHVAPLFKNQNYIDNVITITKEEQKNPFKYLLKVWKVTRKDYDIVIDIMSTPKSEFFTFFSKGAKYRIGRYKKNRGYTYTHSTKEPSSEYDKAEKFLKMLDPLIENGENIKLTADYSLTFLDEEREIIKNKMLDAGVDFNKVLIPLAINSRRPNKVYPVDLMEKLAKEILEKFNCQIILYYSPDEKVFAKEFHKRLGNDKRIISNIKTDTIRELGALISMCDFFIGNEGGPRHLAQAVDTLSFSIFSPGSSKRDWLSKKNIRHEGIESKDIPCDNYDELSYEEKYRLITPEILMEKISEKMEMLEVKKITLNQEIEK